MTARTLLREFEPRDLERQVEIGTALEPDAARNVEVIRYQDRTWRPDYLRRRLVAERDGQMVGWGEVGHLWFAYHPLRYGMRIEVAPESQRRGVGSALYALLLMQLDEWQAELVRC